MRNHTKEIKPLEHKTRRHTTTSTTLGRTSHLNNIQSKIQTLSSATGFPPDSALPIRVKTTNKKTQRKSHPTQTPGPTLGGQKLKGRKNSTLLISHKPGRMAKNKRIQEKENLKLPHWQTQSIDPVFTATYIALTAL